jgi:hypothetical protein
MQPILHPTEQVRQYEQVANELLAAARTSALSWNESLRLGRILFFLSIDNPRKQPAAEQYLEQLTRQFPDRALVSMYQATLLAMRARNTHWPLEKYQMVTQALAEMNRIIARGFGPELLEMRFLRAAVLYHLPAIFGKQQLARQELRWVYRELTTKHTALEPELLDKIFNFLLLTEQVLLAHERTWLLSQQLAMRNQAKG